jgi:transcriptional regulator with XRE-family HTH domain
MGNSYAKQDQKFLKEVGQKIRTARQKIELSQEAFAQVCMLDRTYISDVERGERNLSLLNLRKIAQALNVTMSSLIN